LGEKLLPLLKLSSCDFMPAVEDAPEFKPVSDVTYLAIDIIELGLKLAAVIEVARFVCTVIGKMP
jgi:hypothetical protein